MSRHFSLPPRFLPLLGLVLTLFSLSTGAATFTVTNLNDSDPTFERRATLADLPLAAQYTLSAQFGREDPAYQFDTSTIAPQAANPRQRLSATFTPAGLRVQVGNTEWSLTLTGWGRGDALTTPDLEVTPHLNANRLEYAHGPLTAWYVNGPLGVQQGWTIQTRHAGNGMLALALRSQGLSAQVEATGRSLTLTDDQGKAHLRYGGLLAFDATGRELPARFVTEEDHLRITVNDTGATYPLIIDPWVQVAKLTASDWADVYDPYGWTVAISGDGGTIVAGAPSAGAPNYTLGAAYVFVRPAGGWATATQTAKLTASDGANGGCLGRDVAVSADGGTIVSSQSGMGCTPGGATYVFVRPAGGWADATQTAKLTASDGAGEGWSVAVSADGGTIVSGVPSRSGVSGTRRGATYVFVRPPGGWADATQTAKLTASDGADPGWFVAANADGGTIIARSGRAYSGPGPGFVSLGATYVFVRRAGGWTDTTQTAKLTASDGGLNDQSGTVAVSADGGTVVVGSPDNPADGGIQRGAAYVFDRPAEGWADVTQTAKLTASDGANGDYLGESVAMNGDGGIIVASAPTYFNSSPGATYVFIRPAEGWANATQTDKLTGVNNDRLGGAVAVSADGSVIANAGNADEGDHTGVVYVFDQMVTDIPTMSLWALLLLGILLAGGAWLAQVRRIHSLRR